MNQLLNTGTNLIAYVPPLMVLVLILVGIKFVKTLMKVNEVWDKDEDLAKRLKKSYLWQLFIMTLALFFLVFAGFFAYGPGKRQRTTDYQKSGWMERVKELPDEKPIAVITQEGEANKDKTGTLPKVASEEEYKKSKEEADNEINEILKRKQTQQ